MKALAVFLFCYMICEVLARAILLGKNEYPREISRGAEIGNMLFGVGLLVWSAVVLFR